MISMTESLIHIFEKNILELERVISSKSENYFFTEKEIHSYFYHLCLNNIGDCQGLSLVHTEYPTPFKCIEIKEPPYIKRSATDAGKHMRAHIDMVLFNPNYYDFIAKNNRGKITNKSIGYINGIMNDRFSTYIGLLRSMYEAFAKKHHEPVLLYALEFKFHRHTFEGPRASSKGLERDISKLNLLTAEQYGGEMFCGKVKSIAVVGTRIQNNQRSALETVQKNNSKLCHIISGAPP